MNRRKFSRLVISFLCLLFASGASKKTSTSTAYQTIIEYHNTEPNTVYKAYPDGTLKLQSRVNYNEEQLLTDSAYFLSRLVNEKDTSYYGHSIADSFYYQYDAQNRLVARTNFTSSKSRLVGVDQYEYAGDSIVHHYQSYRYDSGEKARRDLRDIKWYNKSKLVKKFTKKSYRKDHILEQWFYHDEDLTRYFVKNMTYEHIERFGQLVLNYTQKTIDFKNGKPVRDEVYHFVRENDKDTLERSLHYYDSYGTIIKMENTFVNEDYDGNKQWGETFSRNRTGNRNRGVGINPLNEYIAVIQNQEAYANNLKVNFDLIYRRDYGYNEKQRLILIEDSFKIKYKNLSSSLVKMTTELLDNNDGLLVEQQELRTFNGYKPTTQVVEYRYHSPEKLKSQKRVTNNNRDEVQYRFYYREGSLKATANAYESVNDQRDSMVYLFDSITGEEMGKVLFRNGEPADGYYKEHNSKGQLPRNFDEEGTNTDVIYEYNAQGELIRTIHFKAYYYPLDGANRKHEYDLLYGPVRK